MKLTFVIGLLEDRKKQSNQEKKVVRRRLGCFIVCLELGFE